MDMEAEDGVESVASHLNPRLTMRVQLHDARPAAGGRPPLGIEVEPAGRSQQRHRLDGRA
jgi:hypothetical protein